MTIGRHNWQSLAVLSLVGLGMAVGCFLNMDPHAGITPESELLEATGRLAWMQEYKYGTRFGLVGRRERFNYPSKANGMGAVRHSLRQAGQDLVSIRYEPQTHGPIYSDEKYHDVWELAVGGRPIRTYRETAEAWKADNRLVPWLGTAMAICGLWLGYAAWRERRAVLRGNHPDGRFHAPRP